MDKRPSLPKKGAPERHSLALLVEIRLDWKGFAMDKRPSLFCLLCQRRRKKSFRTLTPHDYFYFFFAATIKFELFNV
jgi:hypothetical protein